MKKLNLVTRHLLPVIIIVLLLLPLAAPQPTYAGTTSIYSSTSDGHATQTGSVYATVRTAATGSTSASATTLNIGQQASSTQ